MDSLVFRLVKPTAALLAVAAMAPQTSVATIHTVRCFSRFAVCDVVDHFAGISRFRDILATTHHDWNNCAVDAPALTVGVLRQCLYTLSLFPPSLPECAGTGDANSYRDVLASTVASVLDQCCAVRSARAEVELLSGHDSCVLNGLMLAAVVPEVDLAKQFAHAWYCRLPLRSLSSSKSAHSTTSLLSHEDLHSESAMDVSYLLEAIAKQPSASWMLTDVVDVRLVVSIVVESLKTPDARGTRWAEMSLVVLVTVLSRHGLWHIVPSNEWQSVLKNLSLWPPTTQSVGGAASNNSHNNSSVFCSAQDTNVVFPAMLAVLHSETPLILRECLLPRVGEDLFALLTHFWPTSMTLQCFSTLADNASRDQKDILCALLDEQWRNHRAISASTEAATTNSRETEALSSAVGNLDGGDEAAPGADTASSRGGHSPSGRTRRHVTGFERAMSSERPHSLKSERHLIPFPEAFLFARAMLNDDAPGVDGAGGPPHPSPSSSLLDALDMVVATAKQLCAQFATRGRISRSTSSPWAATLAMVAYAVERCCLTVSAAQAETLFSPLLLRAGASSLADELDARSCTVLMRFPTLMRLAGMEAKLTAIVDAQVAAGAGFTHAQLAELVRTCKATNDSPIASDGQRAVLSPAVIEAAMTRVPKRVRFGVPL